MKGGLQDLNWYSRQKKFNRQVVSIASHSLGHSDSLACYLNLQDLQLSLLSFPVLHY